MGVSSNGGWQGSVALVGKKQKICGLWLRVTWLWDCGWTLVISNCCPGLWHMEGRATRKGVGFVTSPCHADQHHHLHHICSELLRACRLAYFPSPPCCLLPARVPAVAVCKLQSRCTTYSCMNCMHSCILSQTATTTCDLRAIDLLHLAS